MKLDPDGPWVGWVVGAMFGLMALAIIMVMVVVLVGSHRERQTLQALPPAERAVERHVMPDGTICYQPRTGWSRPLSCVRAP